jgi:hypothetical protein
MLYELLIIASLKGQVSAFHWPKTYADARACTDAMRFEVWKSLKPMPGVEVELECRLKQESLHAR